MFLFVTYSPYALSTIWTADYADYADDADETDFDAVGGPTGVDASAGGRKSA